jgi:hypothetical protein
VAEDNGKGWEDRGKKTVGGHATKEGGMVKKGEAVLPSSKRICGNRIRSTRRSEDARMSSTWHLQWCMPAEPILRKICFNQPWRGFGMC